MIEKQISKHIISFTKGFIVPEPKKENNKNIVLSLHVNFLQFGYVFSDELINQLAKCDIDYLNKLNNELLPFLKNEMGSIGVFENFIPFYQNFPEQVLDMDESELFYNAIIHYLSNGKWKPFYIRKERPLNIEKIKYTTINLGTEDDFKNIFSALIGSTTPITKNDTEIIKWFVLNYNNTKIPTDIPLKENLCLLASLGVDGLKIKTVTDVLRIAVYLSGGDISLPPLPPKTIRGSIWSKKRVLNPERDKAKFKKFSRKERKYILSLLENSNCDVREMKLNVQRWLRLGEVIHPGEFKKKYPKSFLCFDLLRNTKVRSWYSELNSEFNKNFNLGLVKLAERPGVFSRKLDWLIRTYPQHINDIILMYSNISNKTSNKVLFEMLEHFEKRNKKTKRSVFTKNSRIRHYLKDLEPLDAEVINLIKTNIYNVLGEKYKLLPDLGRCYVDEKLKNIPIPRNMQTLNFSLKPMIRNTRLAFDNPSAKVIRSFVHWIDKNGTIDLDLSATFFGEKVDPYVIAFTNLKHGTNVHSGDVRHVKGPCAEYVDVNINDTLNSGYRYVVIDVRNYNGGSLMSVDSVFGLMEREYPESNKLWLPETLVGSYRLETNNSNAVISILDLKTKEYILVDEDSDGYRVAYADLVNIENILENAKKPIGFSVYDLIMLHVNNRNGVLINEKETSDSKFQFEDFITSYEKIFSLMGV